MRKKEKEFHPHWKLNQNEFLNYFSSYISFFNKVEVGFCEQMRDEIIPLYSEIFGSEKVTDFDELFDRYESIILLNQKYTEFCHLIYKKSVIKDKEKLLAKCKEFAFKFLCILKQYNLYDEQYNIFINYWFAHSAYSAIRMGYAQLIMPPAAVSAGFSDEILNELWKDFTPSEWIEAESLRFEQISAGEEFIERYNEKPFRPLVLPPASKFQFVCYDIFLDMKIYEEIAVKAYREHIKAYLQNIQNVLKKNGWKRNKVEDYDRIHWLVIWNKFDFQYLWEVVQPIEEYCGVTVTVETLRKAFNKFKRFVFPVKPFGKSGKITADKNAANNSANKK